MSDFIPLSVPSIRGNEWKYIKECLDTEWVSSAGKYVSLFEKRIAEYTGVRHSVAVMNGTAALHISLMLSGVKDGDEVIVPTLTFISPINAVRYVNAFPVFMDADEFYNMDNVRVIQFIREETVFRDGFSWNKMTGRRVSAIIPVHIFGNAVWLDDLIEECKQRNIKVIEDATEALGTRYLRGKFKGKHTGTVGDFGCLSFNGNKIITTGGGGIILTNNEELADRARYLTTQAKDDEVRYIHDEVGFNYRLTNIQAALGVAQLEQLPEYIRIKKQNYFYYKDKIEATSGLTLAEMPDYADNNHWLYSLQIDSATYGKDREALMKHLSDHQIQTRPVWYLNHLQKPYRQFQAYQIDHAYHLVENTLNIPSSVRLSTREVDRIIKILGGS